MIQEKNNVNDNLWFVQTTKKNNDKSITKNQNSLDQDTTIIDFSKSILLSNKKKVYYNQTNSFGACLMTMDDNHFLIEWLAYHYHALPLRRLIVANDPKSKTSPTPILDRYRNLGLMNITEWDLPDYMPSEKLFNHKLLLRQKNETRRKNEYILRQQMFYAKCMSILKYEGHNWVAIIDTDEYVVPNLIHKHKKLVHYNPTMTIYEIIERNKRAINGYGNQTYHKMLRSSCISMPRVHFSVKDIVNGKHNENRNGNHVVLTTHDLNYNNNVSLFVVPHGFNSTNFVTLRYIYYAHGIQNKLSLRPPKCLVKLSNLLSKEFDYQNVNPHRPIMSRCHKDNFRVPRIAAPLIVNHYMGTFEQWSFRNDSRRHHEEYNDLYNFDDFGLQDETIRPWLSQFVSENGYELSKYLLNGVGDLEFSASFAKGKHFVFEK